jgi:hypothetical protein
MKPVNVLRLPIFSNIVNPMSFRDLAAFVPRSTLGTKWLIQRHRSSWQWRGRPQVNMWLLVQRANAGTGVRLH